MAISAGEVKALRDRTGAGMMDCKKALAEAQGDAEKAVEILRRKGMAGLEKRAGRAANEGLVDSYIHAGGKIGVLVEVNCETDFVASNDDFKEFVHNLAMQIAAARPRWIGREDVPEDVVEAERKLYCEQAAETGKPDHVIEKIVEGKLEKFYQQVCLLEQTFIKDDGLRIKDLLGELAAKIGENISIARFVRFEVGAQETE